MSGNLNMHGCNCIYKLQLTICERSRLPLLSILRFSTNYKYSGVVPSLRRMPNSRNHVHNTRSPYHIVLMHGAPPFSLPFTPWYIFRQLTTCKEQAPRQVFQNTMLIAVKNVASANFNKVWMHVFVSTNQRIFAVKLEKMELAAIHDEECWKWQGSYYAI